MLNRRGFLKSLAALPLISFANLTEPKPKTIAKIAVRFNNGDKLEMFIGQKDGQAVCISNSMNHHEGILTTSYEIENIFNRGNLYQYNERKPIIEYRGYNQFGELVYEGIADNETWIDLTV